MARKPKRKKDLGDDMLRGFKEETIQAAIAILFFVAAAFLAFAAFDKAGLVGEKVHIWMTALLGVGYFLLPAAFVILGIAFLITLKQHYPTSKIIGSVLFLVSGLGLTNLISQGSGGILGSMISSPLVRLFDIYVAGVILGAVFLIALLIIFEPQFTIDPLRKLWRMLFKREELEDEGDIDEMTIQGISDDKDEEEDQEELKNEAGGTAAAPLKTAKSKLQKASDEEFSVSGENFVSSFKSLSKTYTPPPLSLLERDKGKPEVGDVKANANIIKRTLLNFGISVEMDEVSIGPSVTRYALKPAEGVKLSRIVALQNDLSLALAAHPIRIEAPIPGKSLVGIEIPNTSKSIVGLATLLGHEEYQQSEKPLMIALGKGISGKSHFANLAKMPHLLIAGATGSGKSVTIHTLITSLIFRNSPENMKFIMIDPKRVELTLYNKIPHLLTPVITDAKKSILALKWAAKEMDRRYDILESESVRDIESYHKNVLAPAIAKMKKTNENEQTATPELMPYIVIIIDELADIMATYPREMEAAIVRLAQMSRAVGIHLVLSTQRPSVNVITGLIKANVPARVALQVASQIDSRTILDAGGAEKLLGAGDLLFISGEMSKPVRIQSAYISETEVKKVAKYLKDTYADELQSELNLSDDAPERNSIFDSIGDDEEVDDDLYEAAREEVIRAGKASTSYIQRKLRVGYARAARLMDILEERGVIGPADGSKPREVLLSAGMSTEASSDAQSDASAEQSEDPTKF